MVWHRYQAVVGTECHYEYVIQQLNRELDQARRLAGEQEREIQQLKAQLQALHRRQFKGRHRPATPPADTPAKKKGGAPLGHPPWRRPKPRLIDHVIPVPAPTSCPHCQCAQLRPVPEVREHLQEDIVLEPCVVTTCFVHQQAHCPKCDREVLQPGPGELLGSYIGPAAKATALYLRYQLNVSDRKISQFFADFFGLKFAPASAYGFERQAVRRGLPLYADLLDKVRALAVDLAAFLWQAHRSTEAAQALLGERFGGVLVADAFASYNGVQPKDRQSCLAHLKTKAKELQQELALLKGRAADPRAHQFCQDVQAFVRTACQAHHRLIRFPELFDRRRGEPTEAPRSRR
jgi:hypothetical protein